jgi:ryanodine receptor 2
MSWLSNTLLTCLTLLIASVGLSLQHRPFESFALYWLLPIFSLFGVAFTIVQLIIVPQSRWLACRAAVQKLWKLAMFYRARLVPFNDPDALDLLEDRLDDIHHSLERRDHEKLSEMVQRLRDEYALLEAPPGKLGDLPGEGLWPPLCKAQIYLQGRLRAQRQWYLRKARKYQMAYFFILGVIGLLYLFNFFWALFAGSAFWLVAISTTIALILFAILDFFNFSPLWHQYRQSAEELESIEKRFHAQVPPFDAPKAEERLQRLVEQVEHVLSTEFSFWFAMLQQRIPGADQPDVEGMAYFPRPIDTKQVHLPEELEALRERLARNVHEEWAMRRLGEGWRPGPERDDVRKLHPCLVEYDKLPEEEKEYDRATAMQTLKVILALGYRIGKG